YAINRYTDVRRCAQDWQTFSSTDGWMVNPPEGNIPILPEDLDPPYHDEWRRVLNPFFAPGPVERIEADARGYARELVDRFADAIVAGPDRNGDPVPWEDKVHILLDVVFGGLATTTTAMAGAVYHLATHADIRRDLVGDMEFVPNAVEEAVRLYSPVVAPAR